MSEGAGAAFVLPDAELLGLDAVVDEILERLGRMEPVTPCLVGRAGSAAPLR